MSERVSIVVAARRLGLDLAAFVVGKHHTLIESPTGRLYRWDQLGGRFVEQVGVVKTTINDSKRRPIRYSGQRGREV